MEAVFEAAAADTAEPPPADTEDEPPAAEFDESRVSGNIALARSGGGALFLKGGAPFESVTEGPSANVELRQHGRKTRWIVRVCEASDLATVESRYSALAVREEADGTLVIDDPDYGTVRFRADGSAEAEGRTVVPKTFTVAGTATMLSAA